MKDIEIESSSKDDKGTGSSGTKGPYPKVKL